jgi:hypothetical protein
MFMQDSTRLMDSFTLSSEDAMQEDQGAPFKCECYELPKATGTKMQPQDIPEDRDKRHDFMRQVPLS